MPYEGYVSFAGTEIVNNARAAAYSSVAVRCVCGDLAASLGDDDYLDPVSDEAPWYDSAAPESKAFWGLAGLEVTGADAATTERQWTEHIGDGGVAGVARRASREIEVKALALAEDEHALSYGLAWLSSALKGSACSTSCTGDDLCLYTACPTRPWENGAPVSSWDPETAGDYLLRVLYDAAVIEGPRVESRTRLTGGVVAEVAFTIKSGIPYWHHTPRRVVDLSLLALPDDVYKDMLTSYDPVAVVTGCEDDAPQDCMSENPYCVAPPFPTEPVLDLPDPCYPTSVFSASRIIFTIPADTNPAWDEKVPVLRIHSGSLPLHRFTIRWYDNPLGYWCAPVDLNPCLACAEITLPFLPRSSTLTIDSRTRRATVECPGDGEVEAAHQLYGPLGGRFDWPTFDCATAMCVEILADASAARDVSVQVDMTSRGDVA